METCGNRESDFIAWRAAGTNHEARVTAAVGTVRTCSACAGDYEDPDRTTSRDELAHMTSYPPASISAQLRHLRKEQHGGYRIEKRCRSAFKFMAGVDQRGTNGPVWEYRLSRRLATVSAIIPARSEAAEVTPSTTSL